VEGQNLVIRYQWVEGQQERHAVRDSRNVMRLLRKSLSGSSRTLSLRLVLPAPSRPSTQRSLSRSSPRSLGTQWRSASWRALQSQAAT
jgi:hypothetical protein